MIKNTSQVETLGLIIELVFFFNTGKNIYVKIKYNIIWKSSKNQMIFYQIIF
jgi:uncharacterized protein (UPF0333 family)